MAEPQYTVASDSETTGEEKSSSAFPETAIGIDIGTSQCSVAVWNGSQVELLKNTRNQKLMRSYVTFKDEVPSGGVSNQLSHEYEILSGAAIFNMKRLIGRVDTDPVVHASKRLPFLVQTLDIGVRPFIAALVSNAWRSTTPEEVLAIFLVELRAMAEVQLKRPIRNVVLTIPVSFSRFQLTRIERACAMAGLHVLRLMPEPTAVALLYAQQQTVHENMGSGSEKNALIFNMGAGYCDVAVTTTAGGVSQIKALAGAAIGGEDILQNMMQHLLPNSENLFLSHGINEIKSLGLLRVATEDAIHRLSSQSNVQVDVDLRNGSKICKVITREEFEEVNLKVFEKCESLLTQCLRDSKVDMEDLTDVILVGGCSYIPNIRNVVKGVCQKEELYKVINPLEAAVCGAALEGAVASGISDPFGSLDLLTIQAIPLGVGIRADGNSFVPIIPRNTTMPARKELIFTTTHDNQTEALILVYEGEGTKVEENHLLGYFKIMGIPAAPKGIPEINVCMDIDASNALRVFAGVVMPGTDQPMAPFMEVRMPTVDDGHGWCAEALNRTYGSTLDLVTAQKKM
ncbi:PREDICTED: heat shock 70 kDa protein 8-like isoform X2 [Populus euphratica]|nr:PREDICTED: heat shock 70 kDa protein 8-like isoform X2 [Populus euphratica]XP_011026368.1 PREDICTED: heat shock 70 kDa protein 8-like isoform X2 [Populus euphratica]XP_011026377.1 PREDICTED: heat shock 70 kDa protein 8-like isoform X2 [Populus euphratica]XP_011026384.1 PREDICTED: heat shock 70 kDa protein 8-like isoform X2 [Populus euphratica]